MWPGPYSVHFGSNLNRFFVFSFELGKFGGVFEYSWKQDLYVKQGILERWYSLVGLPWNDQSNPWRKERETIISYPYALLSTQCLLPILMRGQWFAFHANLWSCIKRKKVRGKFFFSNHLLINVYRTCNPRVTVLNLFCNIVPGLQKCKL